MSHSSPITTHVLDISLGLPAEGIGVVLEREDASGWRAVASGITNSDGRVAELLPAGSLEAGSYRLSFATGEYLKSTGAAGFYPQVTVEFTITDPSTHYHVPLLLSPYGYSTYRGS